MVASPSLAFGRFFDGLPADMRAALDRAGSVVRYRSGAMIHQRGDRKPGLSIIQHGAVRFGTVDEAGEVVTYGILRQGECFGEMTLFIDAPRALDAVAMGETAIVQVPRASFRQLLDSQPALRDHLLASLAYQLALALDLFESGRRLPVTARVARTLLDLVEPDGGGHAVRASQSAIAQAVGVSRVTIGKVLAALAAEGLIRIGYGRIDVPDRTALDAWIRRRETVAPIVDTARRGYY